MHHVRRHLVVSAVLALVALPSVGSAQYFPHSRNRMPTPLPIPPVSVAKVVLDKEKDFALTDSQRVQLNLVQRRLDSANAPFLARLDSLRPTSRPANGFDDLSQEQREDLDARRAAMTVVIAKMEGNFATARLRTLALLAPKQHGKVAKLEKEAKKKAEQRARKEFEELDRFERPSRQGGRTNGHARAASD